MRYEEFTIEGRSGDLRRTGQDVRLTSCSFGRLPGRTDPDDQAGSKGEADAC